MKPHYVKALSLFAAISVYFSYVNRGAGFFPTMNAFMLSTTAVGLCFVTLCVLLSISSGRIAAGVSPVHMRTTQLVLIVMLVTVQDRNQGITGVCFLALIVIVAAWRRAAQGKLAEWTLLRLDLALIVVVASAGRLIRIINVPFGAHSDMLPLIQRALEAFLAGSSPYQVYAMTAGTGATYELPLTYLPATWLAYLPAHLIGADLRLTNLVLEMLILGSLAVWVATSGSAFPDVGHRWLATSFLAVYGLNGQLIRRVDTEVSVLGALIVVIFFALLRLRWRRLFIAIGLSLAASPLALLLAPFYGFFAVNRRGLKDAFRGTLVSVATAVAVIVPFAAFAPIQFKRGLWDHWRPLVDSPGAWALNAMMNVNYSVVFYSRDAQSWLPAIQVVLYATTLIAGYALSAGYGRREHALVWSALGLFLFLNFNLVVWEYLYQPVFLLIALASMASLRFAGTGECAPPAEAAEEAGRAGTVDEPTPGRRTREPR